MKMRRSVVATVVCLLPAAAAHAQGGHAAGSAASAAASAAAAKPVCVDAEVDGRRALSYDCLSQQLKPKADPQAGASQTDSERLSKQPSNRLGTFNLSTERNRFGSNWGRSVTPQRPDAPVAVPPK
ncbi:hypothetical protein GQ57_09580 [Burkholderia sp. MSh2]|uniref:Lipoprotein n=1 Tax=Burkholderia paludis TaxID=1506587 RepID=A0A6J5E5W5_9BURK|nr:MULTISPECIES: hypothetical protein [Burkholderia]KEZ05979.1 hypothetical protein GQ57_09580 [Burkholderia sp. MSh2]KFG96758.1 hypothetical protein GQ56_0113260 [Burkholderia paludis]CAB3761899.1 hypothetical protein LMG30113_04060 [Burkholderia paludis]VWB38891.1 hypothetical protein BPA30113_01591 [Burkholderia paludis]